MQMEIKIIDEESKLVNWKRFDSRMMAWLKRILIMDAVAISAAILLKALLSIVGM